MVLRERMVHQVPLAAASSAKNPAPSSVWSEGGQDGVHQARGEHQVPLEP